VSAVAKQYRSTLKVHLWCSKEHAASFAEACPSPVEVHGLDATGASASASGSLPAALAATVRVLEENKAYSAIKDVLMLYVLVTYGGAYLDTTTAAMPTPLRLKHGGDTLDGGISSAVMGMRNLLGFGFAEIGFGGLRDFREGCVPWSPSAGSGTPLFTPSIDYWAAWSVPGNAVIGASLDWYMKLVKAMPGDALQSKRRDSIIGDLITLSVQYGMAPLLKEKIKDGASAESAAKLIAKQMWTAAVLDATDYETYHANFVLPPIGMIKWHKGTWRSAAKKTAT